MTGHLTLVESGNSVYEPQRGWLQSSILQPNTLPRRYPLQSSRSINPPASSQRQRPQCFCYGNRYYAPTCGRSQGAVCWLGHRPTTNLFYLVISIKCWILLCAFFAFSVPISLVLIANPDAPDKKMNKYLSVRIARSTAFQLYSP